MKRYIYEGPYSYLPRLPIQYSSITGVGLVSLTEEEAHDLSYKPGVLYVQEQYVSPPLLTQDLDDNRRHLLDVFNALTSSFLGVLGSPQIAHKYHERRSRK